MKKRLYILLITLVFTACNSINHTYTSHQSTVSYPIKEYPLVLDSTAATQAFKRDTVPVERIITHNRPHEEIRFKRNKTCTYFFMSNGSDSGPIYRQWKGGFTQRNDTVRVNFTEFRSIGHSTTVYTNETIEDREWKEMQAIKSTYFFSNDSDTLWVIDRYGKKGLDYVKR